MRFAQLHALRLASEQASDEYMRAQAWLVEALEGAQKGTNPWPSPADYNYIAVLGRQATEALRNYLDFVGVPKSPLRSASDRMRLIQRLAESERRWQPTPEAWLKEQDGET